MQSCYVVSSHAPAGSCQGPACAASVVFPYLNGWLLLHQKRLCYYEIRNGLDTSVELVGTSLKCGKTELQHESRAHHDPSRSHA